MLLTSLPSQLQTLPLPQLHSPIELDLVGFLQEGGLLLPSLLPPLLETIPLLLQKAVSSGEVADGSRESLHISFSFTNTNQCKEIFGNFSEDPDRFWMSC